MRPDQHKQAKAREWKKKNAEPATRKGKDLVPEQQVLETGAIQNKSEEDEREFLSLIGNVNAGENHFQFNKEKLSEKYFLDRFHLDLAQLGQHFDKEDYLSYLSTAPFRKEKIQGNHKLFDIPFKFVYHSKAIAHITPIQAPGIDSEFIAPKFVTEVNAKKEDIGDWLEEFM